MLSGGCQGVERYLLGFSGWCYVVAKVLWTGACKAVARVFKVVTVVFPKCCKEVVEPLMWVSGC